MNDGVFLINFSLFIEALTIKLVNLLLLSGELCALVSNHAI